METLLINLKAFRRLPLKYQAAVIVPVLIILSWFLSYLFHLSSTTAPSSPQNTAIITSLTPQQEADARMEKAKGDFGTIAEMAKQSCRHPLTASINFSDVTFTPIDSTSETVAIQGTGTAKNSFGVEDQFTYTAYIAVSLNGQDSIYSFDIR